MNSRVFFHRHTFVALLVGAASLWSASKMTFTQPQGFNATQYQLSAPFFRFISAGFWPAAVDTLWIQTIQKIGTANYALETLPEVREFYRLATDLDPNFYELYEQGAVLFSFFYESGDAAREILENGIRVYEGGKTTSKFWTHPATLYIFLANAYAFQLNDWSKAKEVYLRASQVPNAPEYLVRMQGWLQKEGSEKVLAVRVLRLLVQNTDDLVVRAKYEEKLKTYEH
jgi:hypothetical protein